MCPRQRLSDRARAATEIFPINAACLECREISAVVKEIRPAIKFRPVPPCLIERRCKAPVAARKDALNHGETRIVIVECDRAVRNVLFEQLLTPLKFLNRQLSEPLKGSIRFRHKTGDRNGHLAAALAANLRVEINDLLRKLRDSDNVLIRLRRQAHHKVELDLLPSMTKRCAARFQQIFLRHSLVDDIAHALRASLRRKGEPGLTHRLHLVRKIN